jgi:hypothetical protein
MFPSRKAVSSTALHVTTAIHLERPGENAKVLLSQIVKIIRSMLNASYLFHRFDIKYHRA